MRWKLHLSRSEWRKTLEFGERNARERGLTAADVETEDCRRPVRLRPLSAPSNGRYKYSHFGPELRWGSPSNTRLGRIRTDPPRGVRRHSRRSDARPAPREVRLARSRDRPRTHSDLTVCRARRAQATNRRHNGRSDRQPHYRMRCRFPVRISCHRRQSSSEASAVRRHANHQGRGLSRDLRSQAANTRATLSPPQSVGC